MRSLLVFMLLVPSLAAADAKSDVDKLVRGNVLGGQPDSFTKKPFIWMSGHDSEVSNQVGNFIGLSSEAPVTVDKSKIEKLEVVVNDEAAFAWFHGAATHTLKVKGQGDAMTTPYRFNGIAVKDGTWKIAAVSYTRVSDDKDIFAAAAKLEGSWRKPKKLAQTGDAKIAATVTDWFAQATFAKAASGGKRVASGTSKAEYAADAATAKLVASWDKLKMHAIKIDVQPLAAGKVAFVRVLAGMPIPKQQKFAPFVLTAVLVPEGDGWRWTSLLWIDHLGSPSTPDKE